MMFKKWCVLILIVLVGCKITGKVTRHGAGLPGVTVSITGSDGTVRTTTTNDNGVFTFVDPPHDTYRVTPVLPGHNFTPDYRLVTLANADVNSVNFTTASMSPGRLTVAASSGGKVVSDDGHIDCGTACGHTYDAGDTVTLTAQAQAGFQFMNWIGDCSGTKTICQLTVDGNMSAESFFNRQDDPDLGFPFTTEEGRVIRLSYTGSSDRYDRVGIFNPDESDNRNPLEWAYLPEDHGTVDIRVPTNPDQMDHIYQLRMINSLFETIVIDETIFVQNYAAEFVPTDLSTTPAFDIGVQYRGSTHRYDRIATFEVVAANDEQVTYNYLTEDEGAVNLEAPCYEGEFEIRMVNSKNETIKAGGTLTLAYPQASISSQPIALPGESIRVEYTGSTNRYDRIVLIAQQMGSTDYAAWRYVDGAANTLSLTVPDTPGIYDLRLVNHCGYVIAEENKVSVLEPDVPAVYSAPEVASPAETLTIAYSGSTGSEEAPDWVGLFVQSAPNSAPSASVVLPVGSVGNTTLITPNNYNTYLYELRLINNANVTLAKGNLVHILDPAKTYVRIQDRVVQGDTVRVVFAGSTDRYDRIAVFPEGQDDPTGHVVWTYATTDSGFKDLRVPLVTGHYEIRLIDPTRQTIADGNSFIVEPYQATAVLSSYHTTPDDTIQVTYTGSTNRYDRIAFYLPGAANDEMLTWGYLTQDEGIMSVKLPPEEGVYEARMINSAYGLILALPNPITLSYGTLSLDAPAIAYPGEEIQITYEGSMERYDRIALYPQDSNQLAAWKYTNGVPSGTLTLNVPLNTGVYDVKLVNSAQVVITDGMEGVNGVRIAVLDPAQTAAWIGPETVTTVDNAAGEEVYFITVGYSGSNASEENPDWIGLFELTDTNNTAPLEQVILPVGSIGSIRLTAPTAGGIYQVRLVDSTNTTIAKANYLKVIDSCEDAVYLPTRVVAGETHKAVFSGSENRYDRVAIYAQGQNDLRQPALWSYANQPEGWLGIRVPTVAGTYQVRLISSTYELISDGHEFVVDDYNAGVSAPPIAGATQKVAISYTGSTDRYDRIATFLPGDDSLQTWAYLPDIQGVVQLTMPAVVDTYELKMINSKSELIFDAGSIALASYSVQVNGPSFVAPGETFPVSYSGSTEPYDRISLYAQELVSKNRVASIYTNGIASGTVELTAPDVPGIYNLVMENQGNVEMGSGGTLSVLVDTEFAVFSAPQLTSPGQTITVTLSGSNVSSNWVGLFESGAQDNLSPLSRSDVMPGSLTGNVTLAVPLVDGVFDLRLVSENGTTLAEGPDVYVIDDSVQAIHGPAVVRAGQTVAVIYSGSTNRYDKAAFYETNTGSAPVHPTYLRNESGAVYMRVPTFEGTVERYFDLTMVDPSYQLIATGTNVTVLPYDGNVDP